MEETLILLGTGNATVTKCFNTCFAIKTGEEYLLVDTGGGNGIMAQLEKAKIPMEAIHEIFMSHEHTDHLLGLVWLIRMIATKMKKGQYEGNLNIYCHKELKEIILTITKLTVQDKFYRMIGERIFFHPVEDKEVRQILGYQMTFFDIRSTKAKQFGFTMQLKNGKRFTFVGDEPYQEHEREYAEGADWFLHEAFCLYRDREIYKPYEKHHTTVKEACEHAEELKVKNLILYHTEDKNIARRKELYTEEGRAYYHCGNLMVPEDLERIVL
jgi:ribonuclease Z